MSKEPGAIHVYQRRDLLFGPGDPSASIMLDEQAVVFTMGFARNANIWPREKPGETEQPESTGKEASQPGKPPDGESATALHGEPHGGHPDGAVSGSFTAEGVLKEALVRLWEQARAKDVKTIAVLSIRMFEAGDAFRLLGAVGAISGAGKRVTIKGGYETREGGSFELDFGGPVSDAQPVKEFLEPQLRDASSTNIEAGFQLSFAEGLPMDGDAAENLTERLAKFARGAAYVSATAEVKA